MKVRKLANNCYVANGDCGWSYGQSYNSTVVMYQEATDKLIFGRDWQYSKTTLKHIQLILKHFLTCPPTTKEIRKGIEDGTYEYNDMLV